MTHVRRQLSGSLIVQLQRYELAGTLLSCAAHSDVPMKVLVPSRLNTSLSVTHNTELAHLTPAEIAELLRDQRVVEAKILQQRLGLRLSA